MRTRSQMLAQLIQIPAAVMLALGLASTTTAFAGGVGGGVLGGGCSADDGSCLTQQPLLESCAGWSLYWNDPCQGVDECETIKFYHPSISPVWFATTDYLPLFRDQGDERAFQTLGPDGPVVLGTNSFDTEFENGLRLTIGRGIGDWYRLEGSWMTASSWSSEAAVRNLDEYDLDGDGTLDGGTSGNLYSPFSGFGTPGVNPTGVVGLDFNRFASIQFSSKFDSAELNLRRRLRMPQRRNARGEASVLVGLRYARVDERFRYLSASELPAVLGTLNDVDVATQNDLFGVQIGFLGQILVHNRAWIDADLKGGIFSNRASQDTIYTNTDNNATVTQVAGSALDTRTSFIGDISVVYNYQFAPSWTFRVGYNAIWVTGLALGSENFESDINILTLGPAALDHGGSVVYHGPNIGLTWTH